MTNEFKNSSMQLTSIDLFSGCGGLTQGMHDAGFNTLVAVELVQNAIEAYKLNHPNTEVIDSDIRNITGSQLKAKTKDEPIHLLAGCPPCQGFSSIRRLNRTEPIEDDRNGLITEYVRMIKIVRPYTIMMENVPALINYNLFHKAVSELKSLGYKWIDYKVVNVKDYGVPQSRRRLVMVGSRLGEIKVADAINEKKTVRQIIGKLPLPEKSKDPIHKIFPTHTPEVLERISITPHNGGSRKDLPERYTLACHKKKNVGFNDIYGRLRWDDYSTTITGGCLNPSKGRFLHPEQDRCISAREAALLQSFPMNYKFPKGISRTALALLIGNALPPKFSYHQSLNIKKHIESHLSK
jgi:DNA (cytosine-5)-methyltransferase 1